MLNNTLTMSVNNQNVYSKNQLGCNNNHLRSTIVRQGSEAHINLYSFVEANKPLFSEGISIDIIK